MGGRLKSPDCSPRRRSHGLNSHGPNNLGAGGAVGTVQIQLEPFRPFALDLGNELGRARRVA